MSRGRGNLVKGEHQHSVKYSRFQPLSPQALDRFSAAYSPSFRRLLAAFPHANPQYFRAFSTSFAHAGGRGYFRRFCAAISQENSGLDRKKNGRKGGGGGRLRKTRVAVLFGRRRIVFNVAQWLWHVEQCVWSARLVSS